MLQGHCSIELHASENASILYQKKDDDEIDFRTVLIDVQTRTSLVHRSGVVSFKHSSKGTNFK